MKLQIRNLRYFAYIGCYGWEQFAPQSVILNAVLTLKHIPLRLEQTVDYTLLTREIGEFISLNKFALIEDLAVQLLHFITRDAKIIHCSLEIIKPTALSNDGIVSVLVSSSDFS